jgi:hypothetical protein
MADDTSTKSPPASPPASTSTSWSVYSIIGWLMSVLLSISAAMLAYKRNGSSFLAVIAFWFAPLYLPYYAFTEPGPGSSSMMGAARYLRKMF